MIDATGHLVAKQMAEKFDAEIKYLTDALGIRSAHEIRERCVMHVYPDGTQELLIDGMPRLRLGPISIQHTQEDHVTKIQATRTVTHL